MTLLIIKLCAAPLLIALVTLAGRRWGPDISGLLVGLPLTSGPVIVFLALEQGVAFATQAATGIIAGGIAVVAFCLAYARSAQHWSWLVCLGASIAAYLVAMLSLREMTLPVAGETLFVLAVIAVGSQLMPRYAAKHQRASAPRWDLPARMVVATAMVAGITGLSPFLGPRLSGLLSVFPAFTALLAVFTQRSAGAQAAIGLARGVVLGLFAFVAFFVIVAAGLTRIGLGLTVLLAVVAAGVVQGGLVVALRRPAIGPHAEPS